MKRDKRRQFPVAIVGKTGNLATFVLLTAKPTKKVINTLIDTGNLFNTRVSKPKPVATGRPMDTPEMQALYQSLA